MGIRRFAEEDFLSGCEFGAGRRAHPVGGPRRLRQAVFVEQRTPFMLGRPFCRPVGQGLGKYDHGSGRRRRYNDARRLLGSVRDRLRKDETALVTARDTAEPTVIGAAMRLGSSSASTTSTGSWRRNSGRAWSTIAAAAEGPGWSLAP